MNARTRRKVYAQVEAVERAMEEVRASKPFPEHAPTQHVIIQRQLRDLSLEHYRLVKQLGEERER